VNSTNAPVRALDDTALGWAQRAVWAVSIAVYLVVFIGGIHAGGADLTTMGRAAAFAVGTALLGRLVLSFLSRATMPNRQGPMADEDGPVGSLVDLASSANVAQQTDVAEAA
jgi:hypothetical protein